MHSQTEHTADPHDPQDAVAPRRMNPLTKAALWIGSASSAGVLVSVGVHIVMAALAATIVVSGGGGGLGDRAFSKGDGAMVVETTLTTLTESELDTAEGDTIHSIPTLDVPSIDLEAFSGADSMVVDLATGSAEALSGITGSGLGGGAGAGGGSGDGFGDLAGGGGGGSRFFGVEARGSRFVYIVDVSGSMNGDRLVALQRELVSAIDGLVGASSFLVVLFNSDAVPLGGRARWIDASDANKRRMIDMIPKIVAGGGTFPEPGFEIAFSLRPRPDAIYFMTDGLFDDAVADQVARFNRAGERPVPIHCIAFASRDSETIMRDIASKSGGTYVFVAGP